MSSHRIQKVPAMGKIKGLVFDGFLPGEWIKLNGKRGSETRGPKSAEEHEDWGTIRLQSIVDYFKGTERKRKNGKAREVRRDRVPGKNP